MRQLPLVEQAMGRQTLALLGQLNAACTAASDLEHAATESDQENPAQPQRGSGRCGDVLDWTRDGWWFRAWSGLCAVAV
jgi:hypothetical protein